jgi:hypothetical protein
MTPIQSLSSGTRCNWTNQDGTARNDDAVEVLITESFMEEAVTARTQR